MGKMEGMEVKGRGKLSVGFGGWFVPVTTVQLPSAVTDHK